MTKTMTSIAVTAGLLLMGPSAARAQTLTPQPETGAFVSVALGGQPQKRSFGSSGTFSSFNEQGRYDVNQNVGAGFMFDVAGGYFFTKHLGVGASIWSTHAKSAVSAAALIPDPVFFGRFTTVTASNDSDQSQSTLGLNLSVIYTMPVSDRFDVTVSLGPSIVHTKLDVGTVTVTPNSQTVTVSSTSQSVSSAKAGNFSVDFTYRVNEIYGVGLFARFAGGEATLPAVPKMKVGGPQVGGIVRYRF